MGLTNPNAPLHFFALRMGDWEAPEVVDTRLTKVQAEQRRVARTDTASITAEGGPPCDQYDALGHSLGPLAAGPDGIIPQCFTCKRAYCWFRGSLRGDVGRFASQRPYRVIDTGRTSALQRACCLHCSRVEGCPEAEFYSQDRRRREWCAAFEWQEN